MHIGCTRIEREESTGSLLNLVMSSSVGSSNSISQTCSATERLSQDRVSSLRRSVGFWHLSVLNNSLSRSSDHFNSSPAKFRTLQCAFRRLSVHLELCLWTSFRRHCEHNEDTYTTMRRPGRTTVSWSSARYLLVAAMALFTFSWLFAFYAVNSNCRTLSCHTESPSAGQ